MSQEVSESNFNVQVMDGVFPEIPKKSQKYQKYQKNKKLEIWEI